MMSGVMDLCGQRFGRLVVQYRLPNSKNDKAVWMCQCDCGTEKPILAASLRNGRSTSCSCYSVELTVERRTKENPVKRHPLYVTWENMKRRCSDPKHIGYRYYGGRGIEVVAEWRESFQAFVDYMGPKPGPEYSIDRIDNDGNYEPGNVRWATPEVQANNRPNPKAMRTHCPEGHPFVGENLGMGTNGGRICKTCANRRRRELWRLRNLKQADISA